jgi:hypothetical protein
MASTTNREDATKDWRTRHAAVTTLLAQVQTHLSNEALKVMSDGATWGQVGDLGHVREGLEELVAFLTGGAR